MLDAFMCFHPSCKCVGMLHNDVQSSLK